MELNSFLFVMKIYFNLNSPRNEKSECLFHENYNFQSLKNDAMIVGVSSVTSRVPRDKVGDLPLWTARGVGNSLYGLPRGQRNFLFE